MTEQNNMCKDEDVPLVHIVYNNESYTYPLTVKIMGRKPIYHSL